MPYSYISKDHGGWEEERCLMSQEILKLKIPIGPAKIPGR